MTTEFKIEYIKSKEKRLDEKIQKLIDWMKKFPKANPRHNKIPSHILRQYSKTEEEYQKLIEEYSILHNDCIYVEHRKWKGDITEEQEKKCKEANLGGVLGYSNRIESLAIKYRSKRKTYYAYYN